MSFHLCCLVHQSFVCFMGYSRAPFRLTLLLYICILKNTWYIYLCIYIYRYIFYPDFTNTVTTILWTQALSPSHIPWVQSRREAARDRGPPCHVERPAFLMVGGGIRSTLYKSPSYRLTRKRSLSPFPLVSFSLQPSIPLYEHIFFHSFLFIFHFSIPCFIFLSFYVSLTSYFIFLIFFSLIYNFVWIYICIHYTWEDYKLVKFYRY